MNRLNLWKKSNELLSNTLGEFIFPPLCIICDQPRADDNVWFCSDCLITLANNNSNRDACPICSLNQKQRSCTCDIAHTFPFEQLYALFDFDDAVRSIMHHIKYHGKKSLAFYLGKLFATNIPISIFDNIDAAVAIPLHWTRLAKRGYNQAEWIGKGIIECKNGTIPFLTKAIQRSRSTGTQTRLDKESRKRNIHNAFRVVQPELIKGKNLILFDDVVTTGATTAECSRALLKAGCKSVRVVALVRD